MQLHLWEIVTITRECALVTINMFTGNKKVMNWYNTADETSLHAALHIKCVEEANTERFISCFEDHMKRPKAESI